MADVRIGVINWDCALPEDTYFGYHQTRTLSPRKYRSQTPYYADILGEDRITYHYKSAEEYDRELDYAIAAGIDYFAYVFYPDEGSRSHVCNGPCDCSHKVHELNFARLMHERSAKRDKISIAAIVAKHPFAPSDISRLVALMGESYYERIGERPLVYLFQDINEPLLDKKREECDKQSIPRPYFSAMMNELSEDLNYSAVDSLSAYACGKCGITTYGELCDDLLLGNEARLSKGRGLIPLFTTGWDPSPRIDIPSPWVKYEDLSYARAASSEELLTGAERLADWIEKKASDAFVGHIITFAWNEFEEGGWICPTYNPDLSINTERVETFAVISRYFKERLNKEKK